MKYKSFLDAVEIYDSMRSPINKEERAKRIVGKAAAALYPYYGATGQVGVIDSFLTDGEYVLLGEDGAPFLDAFASKAYLISGKAWVNNHAHVLKSKTNNKFLCYYLNYFNYKGYVSGTTRLKLTQAEMKRIPIPDLCMAEQERIVARIEELFSELDVGVETLQKIKQQLAVYRQAVLSGAFSGELTGSAVRDYEILSEFIEKPRYGTSKKCSYEAEKGGIPVYRIPNIDHLSGCISSEDIKYATFNSSELNDLRLESGDLLIIRSNGSVSLVGRAAIVREEQLNAVFAGYLMRLRIKDHAKLLPRFLLHYLNSQQARTYIENKAKSTSGVHNINSKEISDLVLPIYSIEDQVKIIEAIESRTSLCDAIGKTVEQALQGSAAMRQSILKQAFEGGL